MSALNNIKYSVGDSVGNAINMVEENIRNAIENMRESLTRVVKSVCPVSQKSLSP